MNHNHMSLSIATGLNSKLKAIFDGSDWILTEPSSPSSPSSQSSSSSQSIVYTSRINPFEEFRITVEKTKIKVAVPMPHSQVLYQTNLQTEEEVCSYIHTHLDHIRNEEDISSETDST